MLVELVNERLIQEKGNGSSHRHSVKGRSTVFIIVQIYVLFIFFLVRFTNSLRFSKSREVIISTYSKQTTLGNWTNRNNANI